jgi:hypothetical protein
VESGPKTGRLSQSLVVGVVLFQVQHFAFTPFPLIVLAPKYFCCNNLDFPFFGLAPANWVMDNLIPLAHPQATGAKGPR